MSGQLIAWGVQGWGQPEPCPAASLQGGVRGAAPSWELGRQRTAAMEEPTTPPFALCVRRVYDVWAKYRLPITGRPDLAVVLQEKKTCGAAKEGGACELP